MLHLLVVVIVVDSEDDDFAPASDSSPNSAAAAHVAPATAVGTATTGDVSRQLHRRVLVPRNGRHAVAPCTSVVQQAEQRKAQNAKGIPCCISYLMCWLFQKFLPHVLDNRC